MGRLRVRLAKNQTDKDAGRLLASADAALGKAGDVYKRAMKTGSAKEKRRAAQAFDSIQQARRVLANVGMVGSRYDTADEDLVPEANKVARVRTGGAEQTK